METDMLHSAAHALPGFFHSFTDSASLAFHSAGTALFIILDPIRLLYLFAGVCMGLALGILPGIGGVAGTALLLPFTYNLDAPTAFALLLGLGATTTTADPIAAILIRIQPAVRWVAAANALRRPAALAAAGIVH